MKNIRTQNGCHNCLYKITDQEQDGDLEIFCNLVEPIDSKVFYSLTHTRKADEINRAWRGKYAVSAPMICDNFKKGESAIE